jgi:NADPH:quinone reductase-like Zn-dependent oxidoreductase
MHWEEIEDPTCGPDDVLVAVHACGVNHSDLDSRAGTSRWPFTMPWVLGAEFAGTLAEVGANVAGIVVGDPVTAYQQYACGRCSRCTSWDEGLCEQFTVFGTDCWGGYAELVRVPARAIIPLRSDADFVPAAAAQCAVSTAWSMVVTTASVRAGETVLVPSASGGVASAAVQAAKIAGARVIASVGSAEKIESVRALGADTVFCYRDTAVGEAVRAATDTTNRRRLTLKFTHPLRVVGNDETRATSYSPSRNVTTWSTIASSHAPRADGSSPGGQRAITPHPRRIILPKHRITLARRRPSPSGPAPARFSALAPPSLPLQSRFHQYWVERLDVLPRDVVDTADGWPAAERAVWSALVVVAEPV